MLERETYIQVLEYALRATHWNGLLVDSSDRILFNTMPPSCSDKRSTMIAKVNTSRVNVQIDDTFWDIHCSTLHPYDVRMLSIKKSMIS